MLSVNVVPALNVESAEIMVIAASVLNVANVVPAPSKMKLLQQSKTDSPQTPLLNLGEGLFFIGNKIAPSYSSPGQFVIFP